MKEKNNIRIEEYDVNYKTIWNQVLNASQECGFDYLLTWIELCAMVNEARYDYVDTHRMLFFFDNKPIAVWTITVAGDENRKTLLSNETEVIMPLMVAGLTKKVERNCINMALEYIEELCRANHILSFNSAITCKNGSVTKWQELLLSGCCFNSSITNVQHLYYANLSSKDFLSAIQPSTRLKIRHGLEQWDYKVYEQISWEEMNEFRLFHERIKGRATRSVETWKKQTESVNLGEAIVILLRDNNVIVGGGIFYFSTKEGYYNSAAYEKIDGRNNLGHTTQYLACDYFNKKGIEWYHIGECLFENEIPEPTEKERSISRFKSGFATDIFMKVIITCKVREKVGEE